MAEMDTDDWKRVLRRKCKKLRKLAPADPDDEFYAHFARQQDLILSLDKRERRWCREQARARGMRKPSVSAFVVERTASPHLADKTKRRHAAKLAEAKKAGVRSKDLRV